MGREREKQRQIKVQSGECRPRRKEERERKREIRRKKNRKRGRKNEDGVHGASGFPSHLITGALEASVGFAVRQLAFPVRKEKRRVELRALAG